MHFIYSFSGKNFLAYKSKLYTTHQHSIHSFFSFGSHKRRKRQKKRRRYQRKRQVTETVTNQEIAYENFQEDIQDEEFQLPDDTQGSVNTNKSKNWLFL